MVGGGGGPGGRCFRPRRHKHGTMNVVINASSTQYIERRRDHRTLKTVISTER